MYVVEILIVVLVFNLYMFTVRLFSKSLNLKILILTYYMFGSSIYALVTGVFRIGGMVGFFLILLLLVLNLKTLLENFHKTDKKLKKYYYLIFILLFVEVMWTLISNKIDYAFMKDLILATHVIIMLFVIVAFTQKDDFAQFIQFSHLWITLYLLIMIVNLDVKENFYLLTNGYAGGENRIIVSRYLFIYLIFTIYLLRKNYIFILSTVPTIYIYSFVAGRGALVGLGFTVIFYAMMNFKALVKNKYFYIAFASIFFIVAWLVSTIDLEEYKNSIMVAKRALDTGSITGSGRWALLQGILNHIDTMNGLTFLFGYGVGDTAHYLSFEDRPYSYPHNIIIELFFELGILGLFLSLFFLKYNLSFYKENLKDKIMLTLVFSHGVLFFSGMFSSSLHTIPHLLIFTAIVYRLVDVNISTDENSVNTNA